MQRIDPYYVKTAIKSSGGHVHADIQTHIQGGEDP